MMNTTPAGRVHWSFWAIGVAALLWNAMGVMNFFMQLNPGSVAGMSASQRVIIESRPTWATAAFAIAVFTGSAACVLLLFKKSAASYLFAASLAAMVMHMIPYLGMTGSTFRFGASEIAMFILMPLAASVFLFWYAGRVKRQGWVR